MEKAGNIDSGTLEHFSNYKYAPTRATPINVFALTNSALVGMSNTSSVIARPYSKPGSNLRSQRNVHSSESETTMITSVSTQSGRNLGESNNSHDVSQLPPAEE